MFSLRTKLIFVLSLFVLVLLGTSAVVFIREKHQDITYSAFRNVKSFAEVMSGKIVDDYDMYFVQQNTLLFEKEIQQALAKTSFVKSIQVFAYDGSNLYDSASKEYLPAKDTQLLLQIQSKLPSVQTDAGRILFLKNTDQGEQFLDDKDQITPPLGVNERIGTFVFPVSDRYTVAYGISYDSSDRQVSQIQQRIIYLGIFGLILGIGFAWFFGTRIHKPVQSLIQSASIIAKGDLTQRVDIHSRDEFETLGNVFNTMVDGVQKNLKETVARERVLKEFELAGVIQKSILPKTDPKLNDLDIAGGLLPAEEVGGDFYDYLELPGNRLILYVADMPGHGVNAVSLASTLRSLVYGFAQKMPFDQALVEMNRVVKATMPSNAFLTLGALVWDGNQKALQYVNAGHEPLLQYHATEKKVTSTSNTGIALGMTADIAPQLKVETLSLASGDAVLLYSDGISNAWRNEKENYGIARLKRAFTEYASLPSALAIRNALLSDVKEFSGHYRQMDDMTLIVVRKK